MKTDKLKLLLEREWSRQTGLRMGRRESFHHIYSQMAQWRFVRNLENLEGLINRKERQTELPRSDCPALTSGVPFHQSELATHHKFQGKPPNTANTERRRVWLPTRVTGSQFEVMRCVYEYIFFVLFFFFCFFSFRCFRISQMRRSSISSSVITTSGSEKLIHLPFTGKKRFSRRTRKPWTSAPSEVHKTRASQERRNQIQSIRRDEWKNGKMSERRCFKRWQNK